MDTIFETIFVLALDSEEGNLYAPIAEALESVMAGAVLAELVLRGRIELSDGRVLVTNPMPLEHRIMDKALFKIVDTSRPRKLRYWINTLVFEEYLDEIGHYLVMKGVLVRKKKRLYLAAPKNKDLEGNGSLKAYLKKQLWDIVLGGKQPELPEKVLLAFLYHANLLKFIFERGERKKVHKRIGKLILNDDEKSSLGEPYDSIVMMACS